MARRKKLSSTQEQALIGLLHGTARKWDHSRGKSLSVTYQSERPAGYPYFIEGNTVQSLMRRGYVVYHAHNDTANLTAEGHMRASQIEGLKSNCSIARTGAIVSEVLDDV